MKELFGSLRAGRCGRVHGVRGMRLELLTSRQTRTKRTRITVTQGLPLFYLLIHPRSYPMDDVHIKDKSFKLHLSRNTLRNTCTACFINVLGVS